MTCDFRGIPAIFSEMKLNYPKNERLKSKITIGLLFSEGKSVATYPLRLVYRPNEKDVDQKIRIGVSVSKKYFKKAVERNYFKRVLRETYRINQHLVKENLDQSYTFMLFYQSKDWLSFEEINTKTIVLFEKFLTEIKNDTR